ncbi:MAG: MFS transporter, partial [bacterium]|nr:MFS transporter [bacterium]
SIITLYEPIFLYTVLDFSVIQILLFMASVYALYIVLIPFGGKIASRFGYAHAIFFSIPFQILFWFFLLGAEQNFYYIYLAPVVYAIQKSLLWPAFHASLARFANSEQRGREFSMLYAIMSVVQISGPMIGGFLSIMFGLNGLLIIASLIYLCSAIPLFWSKEVFVPKEYKFHDTWELYKTYPARFIGYFGFGEEILVQTIWPVFIFMIVSNFQDLGTLVTIATLAATGLALYIGIYTDKHSKRTVLRIGAWFYILTWLARIPVISPFGVFITDALSRTSKSLVVIPMSTLTYERAESTHIMPYIVGFEQMLALGKLLACLVGIMVFAFTGSFMALFLVGAIFSLFYFLI